MGLTQCKECKKEVSTSAKVCPHCGSKLKMGFLKKAFIGIMGLFILLALIPSEKTPPKKDKTGFCRVHAEMYVQQNMKNPKSYEYVKFDLYKVKDSNTSYAGTLAYRGTNSFGGVVTENRNFDFELTPDDCKIIKVY